jgi:hypothetical protein
VSRLAVSEKTIELIREYAHTSESTLVEACNRGEFIQGIKGKQLTAVRAFGTLMTQLSEFIKATPDEVIRQTLEQGSGLRKCSKIPAKTRTKTASPTSRK